jgi:hypothetical protein
MTKIAILFSLITLNLFAQEEQTISFRKFQIGLNYSIDRCYRVIKQNSVSDIINAMEIPKGSYTYGINFCYNLSKKIGLETGIQFSNKGFQTTDVILNFAQPDPSLPDKFKNIYNFNYLDIPLKANLTVGKKKIRFISSVGIITNFLINSNTTTVNTFKDHTEYKTDPITMVIIKKINLSPLLSFGVDYKINNRMNFKIEPTLRFGILKITDAPSSDYLYNGGINFSYYFGF